MNKSSNAHVLKKIGLRLFVLLIFCLGMSSLVLFSPVKIATANQLTAKPDTSISFDNFAEKVVLTQQGALYQINNSAHFVQLTNRLIIKVSAKKKAHEVKLLHPKITRVSPLFLGEKSHYLLLDIANKYPQTATVISDIKEVLISLQKAQKQPFSHIELVQPDLAFATRRGKKSRQGERQSRSTWRGQPLKTYSQERPVVKSTSTLAKFLLQHGIPQSLLAREGQGVKIAVIDDGFDITHPSLANIQPLFSYDIASKQLSSQPLSPLDSHGTKVAGIIFANNHYEQLQGLASQANAILIRQTDTWTSQTLLSFHLAHLAGAEVINCSWLTSFVMQPVAEAINELSRVGRNGRGTVIVFPAGNQGEEIIENSNEASLNSVLVVGAHDFYLRKMASSNFGKFVDVWAFGGKTLTTFLDHKYGYFSQTSLASALISAMAANVIAENPKRSYSEVKHRLSVMFSDDKLTRASNE